MLYNAGMLSKRYTAMYGLRLYGRQVVASVEVKRFAEVDSEKRLRV
jgi:hypothetical protein